MMAGSPLARGLGRIVGSGAGSGMAVMFLCTGLLGSLFSLLAYGRKEIRTLDEEPQGTPAE